MMPQCQIKVTVIKPKLSYFGYIMHKNECIEKNTMLRMCGGKHTRGRPIIRWVDEIKAITVYK